MGYKELLPISDEQLSSATIKDETSDDPSAVNYLGI